MSKQSNKSTHKSLGFVSDRDIDIWATQAKKKAKVYEHKISSATTKRSKEAFGSNALNKQTINNEEELSIIFNSSLNTLRQKTKSQRSNSSIISNRIKYLEVDLKRKKQMAEIAKSKYQKMIQTRNKSFLEKSTLNKERQSFLKNHYQSVTLQASRIKFQRNNSSINSKNLKTKNNQEARKLKQKTKINEQFIAQREHLEIEKKRRMVEKSHQIQEMGREKLKYLSKAKAMQGKQNHTKKILQQYAKGQMQRKKTKTLVGFFKEKVKKIQEDTKMYTSELREYEQFLGMRFNQRFRNMQSNLYLTS